MLNKRIIIGVSLILILLIAAAIFYLVRNQELLPLTVNWGISFPKGYEITYKADSGPSIFGDGDKYYILCYADGLPQNYLEDFIEGGDDLIEKEVNQILQRLEIDLTKSIDFDQSYLRKKVTRRSEDGQFDHGVLYLIYQHENRKLYIALWKI